MLSNVFFFNDTATTEIYTLSLHDALPIYLRRRVLRRLVQGARVASGATQIYLVRSGARCGDALVPGNHKRDYDQRHQDFSARHHAMVAAFSSARPDRGLSL